LSSSVSVSIFTNSAIAASKGFGWFVTGSPTLFAETVHSFADVANQVLLRIGEVRGQRGPDAEHPLGRGQEKFFWALVSAVSVFFVGCGLNVYHGLHSLFGSATVEPFTPLVIGLLVFAMALESYTLFVAVREIGGLKGVFRNRHRTTVLAVVLEDVIALIGILLTLLVAGISFWLGPRPVFDAVVAVLVGVMLGVMALFLAALNRRLLIDANDSALDRVAKAFLARHGVAADVSSVVVDDDSGVLFVRAKGPVDSHAMGEALKADVRAAGKVVEQVYWQFPPKERSPG
jgi:zinc transporter 9